MAVSIERIKATEWQVLRDVRLRSLLDSPAAFGQSHDEAAAMGDDEWKSIARVSASGSRRVWFFARHHGKVVGIVQARRRPPADCLLFSMWVDPHARRLGVGRALVDAVAQWGESWGAERVVLWVIAVNEPALRFYQRIGFTLLDAGHDAQSGRAYGAFAMERQRVTPRNGRARSSADPSPAG